MNTGKLEQAVELNNLINGCQAFIAHHGTEGAIKSALQGLTGGLGAFGFAGEMAGVLRPEVESHLRNCVRIVTAEKERLQKLFAEL